jgi:hypothetical protein
VCGGYGGTLVWWRNNTRKGLFTPRTRKRNFNRSNRLHHLDKSQIPMFQFMPDRPEVITVLALLVVVGFCFVANRALKLAKSVFLASNKATLGSITDNSR